jgi:hypothetical protein
MVTQGYLRFDQGPTVVQEARIGKDEVTLWPNKVGIIHENIVQESSCRP